MLLISPSRQLFWVLGVSIQLHLVASDGCTNFTFLGYGVELPYIDMRRFKQQIDFVSCPSSLNHSCEIPLRSYNITVPTFLNVSSTQAFKNDSTVDTGGISTWSMEDEEAKTYVFNQSSDVSDCKSIFRQVAEYFEGSFGVVQSPLDITVSTLNFSATQPDLDFTVRSGYSQTLYFKPSMLYTWATFSECDNATLDGFPIEITTPWYSHGDTSGIPSGRFIMETLSLNDSVPEGTKNAGTALSDRAWVGPLIALSILMIGL